MTEVSVGENSLLQGILDSAKADASARLDAARAQAAGIAAENEEKIKSALETEKEKNDAQMRIVQGRYESKVQAYARKYQLKRHGALYEEVLKRLDSDIQKLPLRPDYPQLLEKWITEGIIGLGLDEVIVSFGEGDGVDEAMLARCAEMALKKTGRKFKVGLGYNKLIERGVIISSLDQRVSFNNLISSRLRRFKAEINDIVEGYACKIG